MIAVDTDRDSRIKKMELELARIQAEETTPIHLNANLMREALIQTAGTAAVLAGLARTVANEASRRIDGGAEYLAQSLVGGSNDGRGSDR
jgi:hypothetical protein